MLGWIGDAFDAIGDLFGGGASAVANIADDTFIGGGGGGGLLGSIFDGADDVLGLGFDLFGGGGNNDWGFFGTPGGGYVLGGIVQGVGQALLAPDEDDLRKQAEATTAGREKARREAIRSNYGLSPELKGTGAIAAAPPEERRTPIYTPPRPRPRGRGLNAYATG